MVFCPRNRKTVLIKNNKNIFIEGICSHFADADGDDSDLQQTKSKMEQSS